MKYIVLEKTKPILFPSWINHDEVVKDNSKITSAGFVTLHADEKERVKAVTSGNSTSLRLEPSAHDAILIKHTLR